MIYTWNWERQNWERLSRKDKTRKDKTGNTICWEPILWYSYIHGKNWDFKIWEIQKLGKSFVRIWPPKPRRPICEKFKTEKSKYQEFLFLRIEYIGMTFDKTSFLLLSLLYSKSTNHTNLKIHKKMHQNEKPFSCS